MKGLQFMVKWNEFDEILQTRRCFWKVDELNCDKNERNIDKIEPSQKKVILFHINYTKITQLEGEYQLLKSENDACGNRTVFLHLVWVPQPPRPRPKAQRNPSESEKTSANFC